MSPRIVAKPRNALVNEYPAPPEPMGEPIAYVKLQTTFVMLACVVTNQAGQVVPPLHIPTPASRVRDISWMKPLEFYYFNVDEDTQEFIDEKLKEKIMKDS